MRRSAQVLAPLLAAAAITLPIAHKAIAQESSTKHAESATATVRSGFGSSFREHPAAWIGGAAAGVFLLSAGS